MGLTSGRGSRNGARRAMRAGYAGRHGGEQRASGSLVSGGRCDGYGSADRRGGYRRRASLSGPVLSVVAVVASTAVVAAAAGVDRMLTARPAAAAPAVNMNCTLIVPANPLSAQGLATPYQLIATDPANGPCNEANANQTAFVQGAVLNPQTGQISVYNPLVVDAGTQPAAAPAVPTLPAGAVVALWFGFNGNTLLLAGPDQAQALIAAAQAAAASTGTAPTASATATMPATATANTPAAAAAAGPAAPKAAVQDEGAAPIPPSGGASAGYSASLAQISQDSGNSYSGGYRHHHHSASPSASAAASASMTAPSAMPATQPGAAPPTGAAPSTGTTTVPPVTAGDSAAASATPDTFLRQANCVAGENIGGRFSSFTQVASCNGVAFFQAANAAIAAGKLTVPNPGTARDGQPCLTTRNFGIIDQDQSDNVTTKYLASGNGQIAQDTGANQQAMAGATTLVNGSDNGLIDLFVDPALGCTPWMAPDLASPGATTTALPLDELQSAAFDGKSAGPAALVPLNDPMTLDNNGNFSTDKTNTYRSIVDMPPLPAGETPAQYCGDMESIQGVRLQQDVNLLIGQTSPMPAMADNLFTFLAMRLQQSFGNLKCQNFGLRNDVTTTVNGNGVVVAACFLQQVNAVTPGAGNPTAGMRICPATTTGGTPDDTGQASAATPSGDILGLGVLRPSPPPSLVVVTTGGLSPQAPDVRTATGGRGPAHAGIPSPRSSPVAVRLFLTD